MALKQVVVCSLFMLVLLSGCLGGDDDETTTTSTLKSIIIPSEKTTTITKVPGATSTTTVKVITRDIPDFMTYRNLTKKNTFILDDETQVCLRGKQILVWMFGNTTCEECLWTKGVYDKVVREYEEFGKIIPIRWDMDTGDNALTSKIEDIVPAYDKRILRRYSKDSRLPTFVLGCKYYRVGTGYYHLRDLASEEKELEGALRELIDHYERKSYSESYQNVLKPKLVDSATTSTLFTSSTSTSTTTTTSTTTSTTTTTTTTSTTSTIRGTPGFGNPDTFSEAGGFIHTPEPEKKG